MTEFNNYIKELQSEPIENITEHSKRSALEILFKSIAKTANDKIKILHEPKRKENYGSPDFLIYIDNSIIGYVENKKISENLDKTLKTEQIKKYKELSDNILLTNYIEFIWIKKDVIERETLCYQSDLENKGFKPDSDKIQKVNDLITKFLSQAPIGVASTKELALALAIRSKNLKIYLLDELKRQKKEEHLGRLFGLFRTFKDNVSNDLELSEFADAFAQMLVYGLFLAKLNADTKEVTLRNAEEFIPQSFQLIRELVSFFDELEKNNYKETRWIIEETISIMNNLQLREIKKTLSFVKKSPEQLETDPYIYFYEDFLAAYDSNLRKSKGVYYTPPQVVFFIVSSINQILKDDFKISKGLAQHDKVTALDFATGTGTFLTEIFKQILESITGKAAKELIIKDHLLKNIYGFEYLIAPYTIAHLKLSQLLKDNAYDLSENERLQVYLTNTLEPAYAKVNLFLPGLTEEGKLAKEIKENPVLIITGNPPYSISSSNKDAMILNLLNDYKKGLNERKINLDDDYIKFIRFAHNKISGYGQGIVAVITNNSYLDGITHRRMRESLLNDFDKIYIINLHGNSLKKEGDENVFDIRVGVAVSIFVKTHKPLKNKKVYYFSTKDNELIKRQEKYNFLSNNALNDIKFEELNPEKPNFWFVKKDLTDKRQYQQYFSVNNILKVNSTGIETQKDFITIHFTENELINLLKDFKLKSLNEIKEQYQITDGRDWQLEKAISDIKNKGRIRQIHYKPFDFRVTYYTGKTKGFIAYPRFEVFRHFEKENIGLVVPRQTKMDFNHCFVVKQLAGRNLLDIAGSFGNGYIFPLYTFISNTDANGNGFLFKEEEKRDNFTTEFRKFIRIKYKTTESVNRKEIEKLKQQIENDRKSIEALNEAISLQSNKLIIKSLENNIEELKTEIDNLSEQILDLQSKTTENYYTPNPEQILGYIYAILHSPTYRKKYAEFLKFDFPRIPFCDTLKQFEKISELGWQLIQVHLLNKIPNEKNYEKLAGYMGEGKNIVDKPEYNDNKLYINKEQYFDSIPKEVYEFKIGAYQVLHKYLKDRKGRTLTYDEVVNIENISKALKFTVSQMELIDNEVKNWI